PTLDGGVELASTILLQGTRPDAVVCRNDLLAIGLINAAQSFGLRVPEDVAITGCDNIPVARYIQPSLTTLDMRCEEQGEIAMRRLLAAILQKDSVEDIMLEPRLIIGKSSGRPKAMESKISL
ncbi:MAG TPA: substrate-binding domain-containing protein, partial [Rhodocyclaceae bacterium]|nr:substrate-binding domain-containing protein [Rhodocyclaceae bacterium]